MLPTAKISSTIIPINHLKLFFIFNNLPFAVLKAQIIMRILPSFFVSQSLRQIILRKCSSSFACFFGYNFLFSIQSRREKIIRFFISHEKRKWSEFSRPFSFLNIFSHFARFVSCFRALIHFLTY